MESDKNWHQEHVEGLTIGGRLADMIALKMGSWGFIIAQTVFVFLWVVLNLVGWFFHWDVYPFILLNLIFSTQAAYAAPIIMQSQNRQADRDRRHAEADYRTNVRAKHEIEDLQKRLARIEDDKLEKILKILEKR